MTTLFQSNDSDSLPVLKEWSPEKVLLTSNIGVIAPRGSGVGFWVSDFIHKNRDRFRNIVVIDPTEKINKLYQSISPEILVFNQLDQFALDFLNLLYDRSTSIVNQNECSKTGHCLKDGKFYVKPEDQPILIIFHNCMAAERKYLNSQVMNDILKNNRHYKYCTLTVVQYFNYLAEDTRGNFDVLVVLKVPSLKMVDKSLEYIFNLGDDDDISNKDSGEKEKLAKMLDKYTENYGCLIKDNTTSFSSGKSQFDHFFYYKPSPVPRSFFKEAKFNSCPILKSLETAFLEHTNKAPPKVEKKMDWSSFSCPLIPLSKSNKLLVNVSASSDTNHYRIFSFVPGLVRKDLTIVVNYHQCDSSSSISVDICPTDFAIVDEGKKKKTKRSLFKVLVKYDEHGRPIDDDDYEHVDKEEKQEEKYEEKKCEEKIITKEINYEKFYFSKKTISLKNSIPHPEKLPSAKVENGTLEIIIPYLPYVAPVLKTFVIP